MNEKRSIKQSSVFHSVWYSSWIGLIETPRLCPVWLMLMLVCHALMISLIIRGSLNRRDTLDAAVDSTFSRRDGGEL